MAQKQQSTFVYILEDKTVDLEVWCDNVGESMKLVELIEGVHQVLVAQGNRFFVRVDKRYFVDDVAKEIKEIIDGETQESQEGSEDLDKSEWSSF